MRFKKTAITGALVLGMIVSSGAASAATYTVNGQVIGNLQGLPQGLQQNIQQLLQQGLQQGNSQGTSLDSLLQQYPQLFDPSNWAGLFKSPGNYNMPSGSYHHGRHHGSDWNTGTPSTGTTPTDTPSTGTDTSTTTEPSTGTDTGTTTQPSTGTDTGTTTGTTTDTSSSAYADQVVTLVNQERAKAGLSPLTSDSSLAAMALDKAKDMYNNHYFDHTSPTYGSPFDMMTKYGIQYTYAGENIAMGQQTPQEVMTAWMNSEGHRQNILSPNYTKIGVAFYNNEWVQEFIAN